MAAGARAGGAFAFTARHEELEPFEPRIDLHLKRSAAPVMKHQTRQAGKHIENHQKAEGLQAPSALTEGVCANRRQSPGKEHQGQELQSVLVVFEQHQIQPVTTSPRKSKTRSRRRREGIGRAR